MKNQIIQPFAWYSVKNEQDYLQSHCAELRNHLPLIVTGDDHGIITINIPATQIHGLSGVTKFDLFDMSGGVAGLPLPTTSTQQWPDSGLDVTIIEAQTLEVPVGLAYGSSYYIYLSDGNGNDWYSSWFTLYKADSAGFPMCENALKLTWALTSCSLGEWAHYEKPFSVYVLAALQEPQYVYVSDNKKDGLDNEYSTFKRLEKKYTLEFVGGESMADGLAVMPLFDTLTVTRPSGEVITANADTANTDVDWKTACLAKIKVTFSVEVAVKKCCNQ